MGFQHLAYLYLLANKLQYVFIILSPVLPLTCGMHEIILAA